MLAETHTALRRCAVRVRGTVQGVGFRPFVHQLASELGLDGWVLNDADGVLAEVQGPDAAVQQFLQRLRADAPPLARVESVEVTAQLPAAVAAGFGIRASRGGSVKTAVPADAGTCEACLRELFDPADRRHRYAFINCTHCGPRYTITRRLPYDRACTSMAGFTQCPRCQAEYDDPHDRRFHAEPNACPVCGPQLTLVSEQGRALAGDPLVTTLALLRTGMIVAIKGLGGFHLACDARQAGTVALLRQRKHREEKPFAVMVADAAAARAWVDASDEQLALLASPERPVLLLPLRADRPDALAGVAPGLGKLGVMLPCTPIQHLLFHDAPELVLVMTSANPGGEPLVAGNDEAVARLQGIADALLLHDRDIVARCDDSVLRWGATGAPQFIRRARGWTPRAIRLPRSGPSVLATGAWLKNTVCLTRGDEAFLSPHIGDLDNAATCQALEEAVAHLCGVLDVQPHAVAHDRHPDFFSTRFALAFAAERGLPVHAVQHHHAHIAAVAAEHRHDGPLLGLALDGVGLGDDGAAWGGELLRVDGARFARLGHLREIALPGGDIAAREPWRLGAAALHALGQGEQIATRFAAQPAAGAVAQMLARSLRCPPTSSAGRWFDAAAGLLGVRTHSAFEGQAPMQLEALAATAAEDAVEPATAALIDADGTLDLLPLLAELLHEGSRADPADAARAARQFHVALADGLARWVGAAAQATGLRHVALGGGCFLNALLTRELVARLQALGLQVLEARQAPPNDGGIALGQAWAALCAQNTAGD